MKTIGLTLKTIRENKKLTLRQLAEKAHVQYSQLSNIENCKRLPSLETIDRICQALEITVSQVIYMTELDIAMSSKRKEVYSSISPYFTQIEDVINKMYNDDRNGSNDGESPDGEKEGDNPIVRGGGMKTVEFIN